MDPPPAASAAPHDATSLPSSPPRRGPGHRRAQSEILLGAALPNDLAFDADLGVVGEDFDDDDDADEGGHLFAELLDAGKLDEPPEPGQHPPAPARPRHQHSLSMDGSTSAASGRAAAEAKKAVSDAKLAELALVDPKRAKRILANRQSAARSKERKMRYIGELERKVQALQTDATTLSAQLSMLKGDTTSLTSENSELKLQLQTMEQQVRLQDALNDRLRDEIQQLKIATGQVTANSGKMGNFGVSSFGANPRIYQRNHVQSLLVSQQLQLQQLQIHSQQHQQQQMHMQQQHQSLAHHQQLLQEVVSLSGDMKMKGIATTSRTQDGCSSDCYALESET